MERIRTRFQGLVNIIRFNWHFYVIALSVLIALLMVAFYFPSPIQTSTYVLCGLLIISILISLIVSYYVYDASGLYELRWLNEWIRGNEKKIVNIHAGFDETSTLLQQKFPQAELLVFDFYDPRKHTEISIQRARKAYPSYPGTQSITTSQLPLEDESADTIFLLLAAHEIRKEEERILFFRELHRTLKLTGEIVVVEHLRDLPNFLAYTIGFFHFHSRKVWLKTFRTSGLIIRKEKKINPFITLFILEKHDPSS
jgi:SAM-dependent methyltransferase